MGKKDPATGSQTLATAQFQPVGGDIDANLEIHYDLIAKAAAYGSQLIVFPEMSITGYERKVSGKLTFVMDDPRLERLKSFATKFQMFIICGAPVKVNSELYIGSFIIKPGGTSALYTKQYLHAGEKDFFKSSFSYDPATNLNEARFSIAVCADINYEAHVKKACEAGCTLYIPSIFFSSEGIKNAHNLLEYYSKSYQMNILMSNFTGHVWGIMAGGQSAFWNNQGERIGKMGKNESGLLIIKKENGLWTPGIIH